MTTLTLPTNSKFIPLHQQVSKDIAISEQDFLDQMERDGIEAIIEAGKPHQYGILVSHGTIDGRTVTFHQYAYLSAVGILNVWSEALSVSGNRHERLAACRMSWNSQDPNEDPEHQKLARRVREITYAERRPPPPEERDQSP